MSNLERFFERNKEAFKNCTIARTNLKDLMPTIEELEAMTEEERKAFAEKVVESLIESMKNGEPIDDDE